MLRRFAPRILVATTLVFALGIGCGSAGGGGCGGLKPVDPKPLGFPTDQVIEGGIQARITKPGMDKLISAVTNLLEGQLGPGICAVTENDLVGSPGDLVHLVACDSNACPGGAKGCPAQIILNSKDRPNGINDGLDTLTVTLPDANPPVVHIDLAFDFHLPLYIDYGYLIGSGSCTMDINDHHYSGDAGATPVHVALDIGLGIDPTTGELTINLNNLNILNLDLTSSGCGAIGSFLSTLLSFVDSTLGNLIINFIVDLLKPQINTIIQGFLPKPPGIAGVFDTGALLANFNPPKDANLEMFLVAGGYVQSKAGGLTLGVMSGLNSDRDETTRSPGMTSEPSLCVPSRPTPDLATPPWMLPFNAARNDFLLSPANEFSGNPDPTNGMGALNDVAIGVSRTFFDLAGFHIYNSGTLCLAIGGDALPQLNAGTLSVIVGSLGNILEDRKAPLELVLRPQVPLSFTIGAGTMMDPLLHVAISDMRIDFYAWIEERFVRLLTMGLDLNVGLNLTVAKDANGNAAIQPMLVGVDAANVTIRVSNSDLLQEDPKALEMVFPSLINIATGALGGVVKPITLPSITGFTLDDLTIQRVQTTQDDFLAIFSDIKTGTPSGLIDWTDPNHPKLVGAIQTLASVEHVDVPSAAQMQAMFAGGGAQIADITARPRVTLKLGTENNEGHPVEWAWKIDGGMWRVWTQDPNPVIADDAFFLQGRHTIEVRSRVVNQWTTEDTTPAKLSVLIDSVPPELHPTRDLVKDDRLLFGGFDLVSDTAALTYSWLGIDGQQTNWTSDDFMSITEARTLTEDGSKPLTLFARDEAGNILRSAVDLNPILQFHGRTTAPATSGCGCTVGGATQTSNLLGSGMILLLGLLVLLRRRTTGVAAALGFAALGLYASGCGCQDNGLQCSVDDDCAKMQCAAGQIPQCQSNMCLCTPDVPPGDTGRFSSMMLLGPNAYVAAYNNTYGDLMIGHVTPPAVVTEWDFVDGVPDESPIYANSHVRGGIQTNGDDVGRYTSIQATPKGDPIIAYYDKTHGALKFASFGVLRWHSYTIDKGDGAPEGGGDDIGRWASMTLGPDGAPGIAYTATVQRGPMSMVPEGQLRWAQAKTPDPRGPEDWTITIVDSRPLPDPNAMTGADGGTSPADGGVDMATPPVVSEPLLPEGIALMAATARKQDGSPAIAYYDRTRGNLRYVELVAGKWSTPVILDGEAMDGSDTGDVGQYASLAFDPKDVAHISYVDATHDNLLYVNLATKLPEVVDDGYHPKDEMTLDGLDSPVYHLVGDSSSIQTVGGLIVIAYQDSTVAELRLAEKGMDNKWVLATVAGHAMPFKGSYGFYANLKISNQRAIISSYAINQHPDTPLFYVEVFDIDLGQIM